MIYNSHTFFEFGLWLQWTKNQVLKGCKFPSSILFHESNNNNTNIVICWQAVLHRLLACNMNIYFWFWMLQLTDTHLMIYAVFHRFHTIYKSAINYDEPLMYITDIYYVDMRNNLLFMFLFLYQIVIGVKLECILYKQNVRLWIFNLGRFEK